MEAGQMDIWRILLDAGLVVKLVIGFLVLGSVVSWTVIYFKSKNYKRLAKTNIDFLTWYRNHFNFKNAEDCHIDDCPYKTIFDEVTSEYQKWGHNLNSPFLIQSMERSIKKATAMVQNEMEHSMSLLASIGSISPFIGLFGTVWGIINSFTGLASGGASLDAVAPGIAEALVATAIGLAAAIPAVWFFNQYGRKNEELLGELESFSQQMLNDIQRAVA